jgi:hypothetical protein
MPRRRVPVFAVLLAVLFAGSPSPPAASVPPPPARLAPPRRVRPAGPRPRKRTRRWSADSTRRRGARAISGPWTSC